MEGGTKLGLNGLGRIGKMTVWYHAANKYFEEIVINIGRQVGTSVADVANFIKKDSTYGHLSHYLYGYKAGQVIHDIDEKDKSFSIDGVKIKLLMENRNPAQIGWADHGVELVVDATGKFLDPTEPADAPKGSVRGHLESGARTVIVSAPFKIRDKAKPMPEDAVTTVMGINENDFDPTRHRIVSNASCTTNCLAHMVKPLLSYFGVKRILSAAMSTIHAITGTQPVLDRLPDAGTTDLRKNRSILDNIVLTSTGAANALALVIPEMSKIGFMAESVRVPLSTGSLIILVVNLQELKGEPIRRDTINTIYREAASKDPRGYLLYTDEQNVSGDIKAHPTATAVIEGHETHTRTAMANFDLSNVERLPREVVESLRDTHVEVPITQAVIYGWYDNEMGGFVHMLGDRTVSIAELMGG